MKNAAAHAKKLSTVLKGLKKRATTHEPDADPIEVLTIAVLAWESTTQKARAMYDRLCAGTVDWNDLRVCMPEEIAAIAGDKSAEALERATRLKMALRAVYLRHHEVTLEPDLAGRKREAKAAVVALEGLPTYAAARLLTVCFDVPHVPVDSQVRELLLDKGAIHEDASEDDISAFITRLVKPEDVHDVHARLQAWVDARHEKLQAARKKALQADRRAAKKKRAQSQKDRAARQVLRAKALEASRLAAEEKARQRAARKAEAEARAMTAKTAKPPKKAAKKTAAKKKTVAKRTPTKKKTKKAATKKKAKKKVAKRTPTKKKTKKKVAKRAASGRKSSRRR